MTPKRDIIGGLVSLAVHVGLLGWIAALALPDEPHVPQEPKLAEVELLELVPPSHQPMAPRVDSGPEFASPNPEQPRGDTLQMPAPTLEPSPAQRPQRTPSPSEAPLAAAAEPATTAPETTAPETAGDDPEPAEEPDQGAQGSPRWGTPEGEDRAGAGLGGLGSGGTPDHSAYGAELVRLILVEIDADPVPGLGPRDSLEVELTVLPSGRLAWRDLGKYGYARVVHSTLGPLRLRAVLRRILRASERFPPHPRSFPRERYVVGITVNFRERHG